MTSIRTLQRAKTGLNRIIKRAASGALVCTLLMVPSGVLGGGGLGYSDAESLLLKALREVRLAQLDSARKTITELLGRYPNYRLAHLVQGDLWLAKAKPLQSFGNAQPFEQLVG